MTTAENAHLQYLMAALGIDEMAQTNFCFSAVSLVSVRYYSVGRSDGAGRGSHLVDSMEPDRSIPASPRDRDTQSELVLYLPLN